MSKNPRPHWIETLLVVIILAALAVFILASCTYTRGPCVVTKEVRYKFACEKEGRVIHSSPFEP